MTWYFFLIGPLLCAAAFLWLTTFLRYRVTHRALEVTFLGLCLRRIQFTDIRFISTHRPGFCERWANTLSLRKRELFIERRSGLFKFFLITPRKRYEFKKLLEEAMERAQTAT